MKNYKNSYKIDVIEFKEKLEFVLEHITKALEEDVLNLIDNEGLQKRINNLIMYLIGAMLYQMLSKIIVNNVYYICGY